MCQVEKADKLTRMPQQEEWITALRELFKATLRTQLEIAALRNALFENGAVSQEQFEKALDSLEKQMDTAVDEFAQKAEAARLLSILEKHEGPKQ